MKDFKYWHSIFTTDGESDHIQPVESELIYAEQAVELIENFIPYGKKEKCTS